MRRFFLSTIVGLGVILLTQIGIVEIVKKPGAIQESLYLEYEGVLTDPLDDRETGEYSMVFKIYDSLNSTTPLWEETHEASVIDGAFQVVLGKKRQLPSYEGTTLYVSFF